MNITVTIIRQINLIVAIRPYKFLFKNMTMKKTFFKTMTHVFLCVVIILSMVGGGIAFAEGTPPSGTGDGSAGGTLAWQKQVLVAIADVVIKKLDVAESAVQMNAVLSTSTKQAIISSLQGVEDRLVTYKTQVTQATTLAEVQTLNQQVGQYIQTQKNVIINALKIGFTEIGAAAITKAKNFEVQLKTALALLKVVCPQELATISSIEAQLSTLASNISALSVAIQGQNGTVIIQKMNEINTLIQHLSADIKRVQTSCNIPL